MERLAVIGGLIVAAVFALGALTPDWREHVHIGISDDHGWEQAEPVSADQITTLAETVFTGDRLVVADAAIRLEIIAEDRADFAIGIENAGPLATPLVNAEDGVVRVDGRLGAGVSCRHNGAVVVHGRGGVAREQLPLVRVRAPRAVVLESTGANRVVIGDAQGVTLSLRGCGDAAIGDVAEVLDLTVAGAGDVKVGRVTEARLRLNGSGDVSIAAVASDMEASVAGSGSLMVAEATGAATVSMTGSGEAVLAGGPLQSLDSAVSGSGDIIVRADVNGLAAVRVSGSGDVTVEGVAQTLNATVEGSGEVEVAAVRGEQTRIVRGSGSIEVGAGGPAVPEPPSPPPPPAAPGQAPATP